MAVVIAGAACAPLPRVELAAYTASYAETREITDSVLDIVVPYERVVIRYAIRNRRVVTVADDVPDNIDPSLFKNPDEVRKVTFTRAVVVRNPCAERSAGPDPFCYELRDAYANIGDPPLVGSYRRLADVIARYNALLVAYSDGASGRLLASDLAALNSAVGKISEAAPITNVAGAATFVSGFNAVVGRFAPIAEQTGTLADRERFRRFLLDNYPAIDEAIRLMARNSAILYENVAVGTNLFRIRSRTSSTALKSRRREIRNLIANWTVLLDESRRLLGELYVAMENPNGLESRLRNLNESAVQARIDTSTIKKQIAELGTPVLNE